MIENSRKKAEVKEWTGEVVWVDILTVVEGDIRILQEGSVVFSSRHRDKRFDHMCVKAFKNEEYYYVRIPFQDITEVYRKRFNATNHAVYFKTSQGTEMMFYFPHKNA